MIVPMVIAFSLTILLFGFESGRGTNEIDVIADRFLTLTARLSTDVYKE